MNPRTEAPSLRSLVGHRGFVRAEDTFEAVQQRFASSPCDFFAVLEGRDLIGLCARRDLGTLLGARYGFALHGRAPVRNHLTPDPIRIRADDVLTGVLQVIAARRNEHFYDDVLLVDASGDFLGLVYVRDLVRLQTSLLLGNLDEIAARNREMEDDLRMAREVQVAMLPRDFPACRADEAGLNFAQHYEPAGGVSGDFFDVLPLSSTTAGILICDVMGHGVRSALITAMVRTMVEELRRYATEPGPMLTQINAHLTKLLQRTGDMIFVTAAYAVMDVASRRLTYAQAGHPTPLHRSARTGVAAPLPGANQIGGPALGLMGDHVYASMDLALEPGDVVLFFTDGIFEAANEAGEEFGGARLAAALGQAAGKSLPGCLAAVRAAAADFSVGRPFGDDVCLVACELQA